MTDKTIADLFNHLMLRISDRPSIDYIWECEEIYCWLRVWQFKYDLFKCLNFLCRDSYDADFLSVLCCLSSTLFVIKAYKIRLH